MPRPRRSLKSVPVLLSRGESDDLAGRAARAAECVGLRNVERLVDDQITLLQFRVNRLSLVYGRQVNVEMQLGAGAWRCLHPEGFWASGRTDRLPSAETLRAKLWLTVEVSPKVADALLVRDGAHVT